MHNNNKKKDIHLRDSCCLSGESLRLEFRLVRLELRYAVRRARLEVRLELSPRN